MSVSKFIEEQVVFGYFHTPSYHYKDIHNLYRDLYDPKSKLHDFNEKFQELLPDIEYHDYHYFDIFIPKMESKFLSLKDSIYEILKTLTFTDEPINAISSVELMDFLRSRIDFDDSITNRAIMKIVKSYGNIDKNYKNGLLFKISLRQNLIPNGEIQQLIKENVTVVENSSLRTKELMNYFEMLVSKTGYDFYQNAKEFGSVFRYHCKCLGIELNHVSGRYRNIKLKNHSKPTKKLSFNRVIDSDIDLISQDEFWAILDDLIVIHESNIATTTSHVIFHNIKQKTDKTLPDPKIAYAWLKAYPHRRKLPPIRVYDGIIKNVSLKLL